MYEWRRKSRVAVTVILALTTLSADALFSQGQQPSGQRRTVILDGREVVEGEVIVRYRSETGQIERERAEFETHSDVSEPVGRRGARRVRSRQLTTRQMLAALRANPDVEFAEPNYIVRATAVPNDPSMPSLWGLLNTGQVVDGQTGVAGADIDAVAAWDLTTGSRATVVAVLDSGIDYTHSDLGANVWAAPRQFSVAVGGGTLTCAAGTRGYNAISNTCTQFDDNGHGTHVAGIIGAVGNNGIGVTGVNWTASILALKVLGADGTGTTTDVIKAIDFAIKTKAALGADANVRVLNASWGGAAFSQALANEIEAANSADMLFVAAAGSDGTNNDAAPHYPASVTSANVISVAAADNRGQLASFSNYGATSVDLAAPGQSTLSTLPNNAYGQLSGTSMSAPFVAGAAALVLSSCQLTTAGLKATLLNHVDPVASMSGKTVSGGRLNVNAALQSCAPGNANITVNATSVAPGGTIQATVTNDLPRARDWIGLYSTSANDTTFIDWSYLNGTKTVPAAANGNATVSFTAPSTVGTYHLRLFSNGGYQRLATSSDIVVVLQPSVSIGDVTVTEGNSGTTTATFTVTLSRSSTQTVSVAYATANGSATAGSDFVAASGTLNFSPSTLTRQFTVAINGDTTVEPTETFVVNLSNAINATIADGQGVGTITTDEAPPSPSVTATPSTVSPGGVINVIAANGPGLPRDWIGLYHPGAPDGTIIDWTYLNGQKTVPATGQSNATVQIPAPTSAGTYQLRFFTDGGYSRLATSNVTVAVQPSLTINDVSVNEGNSGTTTATFTVTLSPASSQTVTVGYATANGSATAGSDFVGASGTLTFAPSTLTQTISITINGDTTVEPTETFGVSLSGAVNAVISDGQGTGSITTDDGAPSPSITATPSTVAPGGVINITVANGPGLPRDWIGLYQSSGAADGTFIDWTYLNGQKTVPATGQSTATVQLPAPTTVGTYQLRFFTNGGYTRLATADVTVTAQSGGGSPSLSIASTTVAAGAMIDITVNNPTGNARDWLGLYAIGASDFSFVDWAYLNGQKTPPAVGPTGSVSLQLRAPAQTGTYQVRLFANGGYARLATSVTITVGSDTPSSGASLTVNTPNVSRGGTIQIVVSNGPGNARDWLGIHVPSAGDTTFVGWAYLNGSQSVPATGQSNVTVQLVAPSVAGTYEVRFFANGGYTKLATSTAITVSP